MADKTNKQIAEALDSREGTYHHEVDAYCRILLERLAAAERPRLCQTCAGDYQKVDENDAGCICGGSGLEVDEMQNMREELFEARAIIERFRHYANVFTVLVECATELDRGSNKLEYVSVRKDIYMKALGKM